MKTNDLSMAAKKMSTSNRKRFLFDRRYGWVSVSLPPLPFSVFNSLIKYYSEYLIPFQNWWMETSIWRSSCWWPWNVFTLLPLLFILYSCFFINITNFFFLLKLMVFLGWLIRFCVVPLAKGLVDLASYSVSSSSMLLLLFYDYL